MLSSSSRKKHKQFFNLSSQLLQVLVLFPLLINIFLREHSRPACNVLSFWPDCFGGGWVPLSATQPGLGHPSKSFLSDCHCLQGLLTVLVN